MKNLSYFLALNRMNKVGPRTVSKLLKRWPDLEEMFALSANELVSAGLPPPLAETVAAFNLNDINADFAWLESNANHHLLSWEDERYPKLLQEISDPPIVLYAKGQLDALQQKNLAVVGSRNPSIVGSENARHFSRELARYAITIVSGLALGIDAQAHLGCLEARGKTVAVLGTGIDRIYPHRHGKLAEHIVAEGLLISEFPLKSPPIAGHFPRRNRIISGLSLCTLVIEAAIQSGSLITARTALEQNRDVLAIPGSIHNPLARGCHHLLQQGAKLVTSINDVLDELRVDQPLQTTDKPVISLASNKENLVKFIGFELTTVDQIIMRSGFDIEDVTVKLAELELQGVVSAIPGGYMRS